MIASAFPTNLSRSGASGWKLAMGIQSTDAVSTREINNLFMGWAPFLNLFRLPCGYPDIITLILFTTKITKATKGSDMIFLKLLNFVLFVSFVV